MFARARAGRYAEAAEVTEVDEATMPLEISMSYTDPHSYTDLSQGRVCRVQLHLNVDFEKRCLSGDAHLTFEGLRQGFIDLDTRDLTIIEVTDTHRRSLEWSLGERDPILGSRLRVGLARSTEGVIVKYETSPGASALQWLKPEHTAGGRHPYLFSQCQPNHARSILPIQDSPVVRFTYKAIVNVPDPLVAVMSAAPAERQPGPEPGLSSFLFEMPQPIPAYLIALAVGDIGQKDIGPRCRLYAEPQVLDNAAWEFKPAESILRSAELMFGPYLWDRYDFLVMPPAFPYGGMENPRLNFYTPTLISGDRSSINSLVHELAHSWLGNLVTNASMEDFWLNEGFTVWAERRIIETLEGKEAASLDAAIGRKSLAKALDRFGEDSPYTRLKTDLKGIDPDEVYSQVPYEKGFLFVTLLEQSAGRKQFDRFIREYIEQFKFTSITTEQFLAFLEEKLPGLAEKVGAQQWIYDPGIPENCPKLHSKRLSELLYLAEGWEKGLRPEFGTAHKWRAKEWLVYLTNIPAVLSFEDCKWLDVNFNLSNTPNAEILTEWLVKVASSGYEPGFERIRVFVGSMGRMKFLKPIYKALLEREATTELALELFNKYRETYHPIAQSVLARMIEDQLTAQFPAYKVGSA